MIPTQKLPVTAVAIPAVLAIVARPVVHAYARVHPERRKIHKPAPQSARSFVLWGR